MDRRFFLRRGLVNLAAICINTWDELINALDEKEEKENHCPASRCHQYFESFQSCYPLLSEVSLADLQQAAASLGIPAANKSKLELARLIFEKLEREKAHD